jgi:hypothetical protein
MTDRSLATSADYADALLVARRAKNWLFLLILLMLLVQIAFFFLARYTDAIGGIAPAVSPPSAVAVATAPTSRPVSAREFLHYLSGFTLFFGTIFPLLLGLVLLLIVNIMLVGRLIGLTRVTSAFLWCLVLMLMMFPWQIYFAGSTTPTDFRVPGVLYTWHDLRTNAKFQTTDPYFAVIKWARFFAMPAVAAVVLLTIQVKSNRGLRQALGEESPEITITT